MDWLIDNMEFSSSVAYFIEYLISEAEGMDMDVDGLADYLYNDYKEYV